MSWIIGVLLVIVGAIIGFFVAKFWLGYPTHLKCPKFLIFS